MAFLSAKYIALGIFSQKTLAAVHRWKSLWIKQRAATRCVAVV